MRPPIVRSNSVAALDVIGSGSVRDWMINGVFLARAFTD
jgi:hypothetical protein